VRALQAHDDERAGRPSRFNTGLASVKQLALDLAWSAPMSFAAFVPGRNAELVHQLRAAARGESTERSIYLWGAPGSGRTHLAHALLEAMAQSGAATAYVCCDRETSFAAKLAARQAVAVDDVERLTAAGQLELFHLFNRLKDAGALLVVTGDAPPAQLRLRQDLVTRLGWGLVYQVHTLTDHEKMEALERRARTRGFDLPQEVARYLLTHVARDMGTLFSALDALDRYALQAKRAVTVPLARAALGGHSPDGGRALPREGSAQ
jgi:DnaA-homolog protein